jgi:hypothetical protein
MPSVECGRGNKVGEGFDAAGTASTIGNEPTLMIGVKLALQVIR